MKCVRVSVYCCCIGVYSYGDDNVNSTNWSKKMCELNWVSPKKIIEWNKIIISKWAHTYFGRALRHKHTHFSRCCACACALCLSHSCSEHGLIESMLNDLKSNSHFEFVAVERTESRGEKKKNYRIFNFESDIVSDRTGDGVNRAHWANFKHFIVEDAN